MATAPTIKKGTSNVPVRIQIHRRPGIAAFLPSSSRR
jgi:hypothetical protein